MKTIFSPFNRLLDRAQQKFVRSRRGSVLILVVVLLVLMALIGTAYMSLAQADRTTAAVHTNISQQQMLLDSITELVKSTIAADLTSQGQFRPGTLNYYGVPSGGTPVAPKSLRGNPVINSPPYVPVTGVGPDYAGTMKAISYDSSAISKPAVNVGTTWLASRTPDLFDWTALPSGASAPNPPYNPPYWAHITAPLVGTQFESPFWPNANIPQVFDRNVPNVPTFTGIGLEARFVPTTVNGQPAFDIYDRGFNTRVKINTVIAADADGDGIADSALVKLPMGTTTANGQITWYMGARILDNASAVNVNTAWTPSTTYIATAVNAPAIPGDFFPSSIDLFNLLHFSDSSIPGANNPMTKLLTYRFDLPFPQQMQYGNPSGSYDAREDGSVPRTDFFQSKFSTSLEASWMQLGRRLRNPGLNANSGPFQALPLADALSLAHNFIIPDTIIGGGVFESMFLSSTANINPGTTDPLLWFGNNFAFYTDVTLNNGTNQNRTPIRSLLTTDNPVGNFSPTQFRDLGVVTSVPPAAPVGGFRFGDMISYQYTDGGAPVTRRYVCVNPLLVGITPPNPVLKSGVPLPSRITTFDNDTWIYEPWQSTQTKTNINTATFGQLWLAYWSVMADQARPDGNLGPAFPNSQVPTSPRMFRSPLRYTAPGGSLPAVALSPMQVMQLRAALAAVNAMDMRDSDDDVSSRTVHLIDSQNSTPALRDVVATVYGTERQPFITQVYAAQYPPLGGTPGTGYIAIELFNPYPQPIDLSNYCFATSSRTMATVPPSLTFAAIPWTGGPGVPPSIPPYTSIIIASDASPPAGLIFDPIQTQQGTGGTGTSIFVVNGLNTAFDNELYLMRARRDVIGNPSQYTHFPNAAPLISGPSALPSSPASMIGAFNEGSSGAPNPADMVPVDSYDLTGLTQAALTTGVTTEWYYVRPNPGPGAAVGGSKAWHFVYPGHYVIGSSGIPRFIDGTQMGTIGSLSAGTVFGLSNNVIKSAFDPAKIPMGIPASASIVETLPAKDVYRDIPIQLNNTDSGGPNGQRADTAAVEPNAFPYGGFARNGDMLKVPFIGSYRLAIISGPPNVNGSPLQVIEMNSVTTDSAMALGLSQLPWGEGAETTINVTTTVVNTNGADPICDGTPAQNGIEQVGRFYPLSTADFLNTPNTWTPPDDFGSMAISPIDPVGTPSAFWLYHWTTRLFDYLTVQSPQQDYLPDVDPSPADAALPPKASVLPYKYNPVGGTLRFPVPTPNDNRLIVNGEANNPANLTEEASGVQGLININSAPWRVLMAVPWLPPDYPNVGTGTTDYKTRSIAQANIAMSIVYYRDIDDRTSGTGTPHGHGPFRSIFELNNVPIQQFIVSPSIPNGTLFQNILTSGAAISTVNMTPSQGNLSDVYRTGATPAGAVGDFEARFNMINRVSNLITTRSDSFTAYIVLQGWLNAETPSASLAYQRRAAFFVDRTKVTPTNPLPTITNIPGN